MKPVLLGLPLAALAALPATPSASAARTVTLTIHHSAFSPSEMHVWPGTTVRFVVRNTDPIPHELIVGDQGVQDRHEHGTEAHHGDRPGEVSVGPGQTAVTTYSLPASPGRVLFGCHLPGHWDYGMRGVVWVS